MLLAGINGLFEDPFFAFALFVALAVSLLIAITFHEAAHAVSAKRLGDDTAALLGRVSLNPKRHLDPAGTAMLLVAGFGWGKPVPVDPRRIPGDSVEMAAVSAAGPAANVALALGFALLFRIGLFDPEVTLQGLRSFDLLTWGSWIATYSVLLNLVLAAFNLLPLQPLDGGGILMGTAPRGWLPAIARLQRYGPIVLVGLIAVTIATDLSPLGFIVRPADRIAGVLIGA